MREAAHCSPEVRAPPRVKRELKHMRNLDIASSRHLIPVVGMNVGNMKMTEQLFETETVVLEHVRVEELVQVVKLDDDHPELV